MKIFLSLLFFFNGGIFSLPDKIINQSQKLVLSNAPRMKISPLIHLILNVILLGSPEPDWDVVVCMASVLDFFGVSLENHSYVQLSSDLWTPGHTVGGVLNEIINQEGDINLLPANYFTNHFLPNFGIFLNDIQLFEEYMITSLEHHHPVVFEAWDSGAAETPDTAFLIYGIDNEGDSVLNPWLTRYYCMDPRGQNLLILTAQELLSIGNHHISITGYNPFRAVIPKTLDYAISNEEHGESHLSGMDRKEVQRYDEDLNYSIRAQEIGDFRNHVGFIELPEFVGELYAFNYRIPVTGEDFRISTDILPKNNSESWSSGLIEIKHVVEDSGLAHREAAIYVQIRFFHSPSTNHLIFTLIIFVAGDAWRTPLNGHVWFKTGNFLRFSKC